MTTNNGSFSKAELSLYKTTWRMAYGPKTKQMMFAGQPECPFLECEASRCRMDIRDARIVVALHEVSSMQEHCVLPDLHQPDF
jgi:hypothetical protein